MKILDLLLAGVWLAYAVAPHVTGKEVPTAMFSVACVLVAGLLVAHAYDA
jgi:hypothetical protein